MRLADLEGRPARVELQLEVDAFLVIELELLAGSRRVGALAQEERHERRVAALAGIMERTLAVVIGRVDAGPERDELFHDREGVRVGVESARVVQRIPTEVTAVAKPRAVAVSGRVAVDPRARRPGVQDRKGALGRAARGAERAFERMAFVVSPAIIMAGARVDAGPVPQEEFDRLEVA